MMTENDVGNVSIMREALERVREWLKRMNKERLAAFAESQVTPAYAVNRQAKTIIEDNEYHIGQLDSALAAPARNCDVGTLTEQQQRFHDYCEKMQRTDKACCGGCPIVHLRIQGVIGNSCELAWAQMPYNGGDK